MAPKTLEFVLHYILNTADKAEFEVIQKACERRRRDDGMFASLGGLNPSVMAGKMSDSIQAGIEESMDGLRNTVRDYITRIIKQHEPDVSDEALEAILENALPDRKAMQAEDSVENSGLPPEAVLMMVRDFYDYSNGMMAPSKQQELWDSVPDWQEKYWHSFSPTLKAFIKANLEGRLPEDKFWSAVFSVLGL